MRHINRISLLTPDARQAPFAEFDTINERWRIWQAFSSDVQSGTYLDMYPDGQIDRVTVKDGNVIDITIITGPVT